MANLIVQSGKHKGKKITLPEKEVVIGRDEGCFIRLGSTDISRKHCSITPTPKGLLVRDLESQNGTLVNSAEIETETLLQPGDTLQVGTFLFQLEGARTARPPTAALPRMDDDIAGWLSDSATEIPTSSGDTTIIKAAKLNPPTPAPTPAPKPKPKAEFANTADEARDIIRRHLQGQKD